MYLCKREVESFEHLFFYCDVTKTFWEAFCSWLGECNVKFHPFTIMDIILRVFNTEDNYISLNHLMLTAKFYIYKCKLNLVNLSLRVYRAKISGVYQVERKIAARQNISRNGRSFCHMLAYSMGVLHMSPLSHISLLFPLPLVDSYY